MATAKRTASKKSTSKKAAAKKTARKNAGKTAAKKTTSRTTAAAKRPAKKASGSVKKGVKTSAATAKKTGVKRTNVTQYEQHKSAGGKTVRRKMNPSEAKGKKESLIKQKRSTGEGPACWPGYERVPGKQAGTKGSCKPKPNQTASERKEDAREAAGSKLRKAGGNKAKANRTR
ncbi:MAG TPA: hypothetical protein VKV02_10070 [Acidobacteriaceae bacterium]|nr:hypothetical protein [Acidobacteriaceae bacterium]